MKVQINEEHLLDRIGERIPLSIGRDQTRTLIAECRKAIHDNAPEDWRFTMHPRATFFLAYIGAEGQIKIVGRSYRRTIRSDALYSRLNNAATERRLKGNLTDKVRDAIGECAELYREDLADPAAEIWHELKTAYEADWELEQERHWHPNDENTVQHTRLLYRSFTDAHLAKRPNALLLRSGTGEMELWVRQGNPYVKVSPNCDPSVSYCLFCRLKKNGLAHTEGALWQFTPDGNACRVGAAICSSAPQFPSERPPEGFRSWNYWTLPTFVDARYRDLWVRNKNRGLSDQQKALFGLIEEMYRT